MLDLALQDLPELHDNVKDPLLTFCTREGSKGDESSEFKLKELGLNYVLCSTFALVCPVFSYIKIYSAGI